jgi:antibiotic biosynthesis monooxygenase (ABM) superfamily enzyme
MESTQSGIVTFIVTHHVPNDRTGEFESVNRQLNKIVESAVGYLGINVIRTPGANQIEYTVILRFDRFANLKRWSDSPLRNEYVAKLRTISDHTSERLETGLEYWFTTPDSIQQSHPPRYKMAAVTILVIYPLVLAVPYLVSKLSNAAGIELGFLLEVLVSVLVITLLMTYWAMPLVTRAFSRWIHDASSPKST